ncbi:MAG: cytochrome c oxidase subunit 4 [Austwickia sp.]|jgi:uncharacterized membrane protein|nr:cytochrome c oxidase subunit 4 [Austwickia sp.]MBK8435605.1 cytochrome c oxidase subunit 4 [Austwickia sp.]MBK9100825.1 cytochrome c oxidase subunit 4 [Austwickia sp.]
MKIESVLFSAGFFAFALVGVIYGLLTKWQEPVGPVALIFLAFMCGMVGFYLYNTGRKLDARPEEDPTATQDMAEGDFGFFSPYSWWPLPLAAGAAVTFVGLAVGWWLFFVGVVFSVLALIGWCFEYFRGEAI